MNACTAVLLFFHFICTLYDKQFLQTEIQVRVTRSIFGCDLFNAATADTEFYCGLCFCSSVYFSALRLDIQGCSFGVLVSYPLTQSILINTLQGFGGPDVVASVGVIMGYSLCFCTCVCRGTLIKLRRRSLLS